MIISSTLQNTHKQAKTALGHFSHFSLALMASQQVINLFEDFTRVLSKHFEIYAQNG